MTSSPYPTREHERALLTGGRVERAVEPVGVLVDDLIVDRFWCTGRESVLPCERLRYLGAHANEVARDFGRRYLETNLAEVRRRGDRARVVDRKRGGDEVGLDLASGRGFEQRDRQEVVTPQGGFIHPEERGVESDRRHASTLAVAAVAHLFERAQQVPAGDRHARRHSDHAAAALGVRLANRQASGAGQRSA
jgi:hypothetical protein